MADREIALEGLSTLCNSGVTFFQQGESASRRSIGTQLFLRDLYDAVLDAEDNSPWSEFVFQNLRNVLLGLDGAPKLGTRRLRGGYSDKLTGKNYIIKEEEFFDSQFDYDFTTVTDSKTFWRGGEEYERPCGWQRFALKVLDKYGENKWLGNQKRETRSVPGEWPVSYHGTSKRGAKGIIKEGYEPGPREKYGRGIYSTPYIAEAEQYAKTFTSKKNGKQYKVILQNRINPKYRLKYNKEKYWLIPIEDGSSSDDEKEIVEKAIRPYGLLLKEV
ncbi:hypothetical protein FQA47_014213 [Oryzias melastigma]|uniref:Uncharacterized protein n=1 Tax=Oryzias melastigma TaxID=30732 RepID=A0A834KYM8_ORYME|nr:uncharacterized protein LOC112159501 [Oryzias melastigma]KAF6737107.1 hypothetical protein FQA47_014213 [Oryzias melastigma]